MEMIVFRKTTVIIKAERVWKFEIQSEVEIFDFSFLKRKLWKND